jgi:hypothetical protein
MHRPTRRLDQRANRRHIEAILFVCECEFFACEEHEENGVLVFLLCLVFLVEFYPKMLSSRMDSFPFVIFCFITLVICVASWDDYRKKKRLAAMKAVTEGKEYPNNHHVFGVGYYHATSGVWYQKPWNEFRESHGYFWDGAWHPEPDLRQVLFSMPKVEEITRVNEEWRKADPDHMARFWYQVDIAGFGNATKRSESS